MFSDTFRGYSSAFSKSDITIVLNVFVSNDRVLCNTNVSTWNTDVVCNSSLLQKFYFKLSKKLLKLLTKVRKKSKRIGI